MYEALAAIGVGDGSTPRFGHLPYVMGEGNKKLSKRDPQSARSTSTATEGFLPEGLLNYLALLGWSPGDDHEFFSPHEMVAAFDVARVQPNPARFDPKKADAINGDRIRHAERRRPRRAAACPTSTRSVPSPGSPTDEQRAVIDAAVPLVQERMATLREGAESCCASCSSTRPTSPSTPRTASGCSPTTRGRRCRRRTTRWPALRLVRPRRDRGGAARGPGRRARAQAQGRLRPGARRGHRAPHLPAAVRVDGAARPRAHPGAAAAAARLGVEALARRLGAVTGARAVVLPSVWERRAASGYSCRDVVGPRGSDGHWGMG